MTGVTGLDVELITKAVELLHELAPAATTIGALVNPKNPAYETEMGEARIATNNLGMHLLILNASSHSEIETAFSKLVEERAGALLVAVPVSRRHGRFRFGSMISCNGRREAERSATVRELRVCISVARISGRPV